MLANVKITKTTVRGKIIDNIFKLLFDHQYIIFGGAVRDYILSSKKKYPTDFDIATENVDDAAYDIMNHLNFCFNIEKEEFITRNSKHIKLFMDYKYSTGISIIIDISHKNIVGSNLDFDVNGVYMPDISTYKLVDQISIVPIIDIINQINKKTFRIMKQFERPKAPRKFIGIEESSKKLLEYVKIMDRTCKMFCRGWKLDGQTVEEMFDPCLIKKIEENDNKSCDICAATFRQFELGLDCCKKIICFNCGIDHVKARFGNSEINCPFCRGDLFGWKTANCDVSYENNSTDNVDNINNDQLENTNNNYMFDDYDSNVTSTADSTVSDWAAGDDAVAEWNARGRATFIEGSEGIDGEGSW